MFVELIFVQFVGFLSLEVEGTCLSLLQLLENKHNLDNSVDLIAGDVNHVDLVVLAWFNFDLINRGSNKFGC